MPAWNDVTTVGCDKVADGVWSCDIFTADMLDDLPGDPLYSDVPEIADTTTVSTGEFFSGDGFPRSGGLDEAYMGEGNDEYDATYRIGQGRCHTEDDVLVCSGRYGDD